MLEKQNPWNLALADRPGKGSWTGCVPFAESLFADLQANETPCEIISCHWVGTTNAGQITDVTAIAENHEFVVYKHGSTIYGMDATSKNVKLLPAPSSDIADVPAWFAQWFMGANVLVSNCSRIAAYPSEPLEAGL